MSTINDYLTRGPVRIAPLDVSELSGHVKSRGLYPYSLLPTTGELEERGVFDEGKCERQVQAQLSWMRGNRAEIVTWGSYEKSGQPQTRKCQDAATQALRDCFANVGDIVMLYIGTKGGKQVVYAETMGKSLTLPR